MIAKDRSSFGRDIEQSVASPDRGECPDEIVLSMPICLDPWLQAPRAIRCDVEVVLAEEKFLLTPFPGEISHAVDAFLNDIHNALVGAEGVKCPVFRGSP